MGVSDITDGVYYNNSFAKKQYFFKKIWKKGVMGYEI